MRPNPLLTAYSEAGQATPRSGGPQSRPCPFRDQPPLKLCPGREEVKAERALSSTPSPIARGSGRMVVVLMVFPPSLCKHG